ncbi:dynamin family protein [Helicobacter pylori]|nr:dynamin family protein [Helicobacter pylori]UOS10647.1 dynamin family protein [Helicobacter pylori]
MILRTQTNFVKFLEQVLGVLKEVEIDKTECSILLESIQKQQLVIPVVGNFSAGKSTLLNRVINLFKESIDKVFDRVSAFTWEKYKEENDDEENNTKKRTTMKRTMKKTTRSLKRSRKKQTAESESLRGKLF